MHGHVTLISCSPEAAAMIASGGRISTMDGTAGEIYAKSLAAGQEKNEKLIGKVLSSGHTSVLEHCYVNLSFENVSALAEQFLIEFRLASFTVKSRRYVDFSKAGYVSPVFTANVRSSAAKSAMCAQHRCARFLPSTTSSRRQAFRRRTRGSCCRTAFAVISSVP